MQERRCVLGHLLNKKGKCPHCEKHDDDLAEIARLAAVKGPHEEFVTIYPPR